MCFVFLKCLKNFGMVEGWLAHLTIALPPRGKVSNTPLDQVDEETGH